MSASAGRAKTVVRVVVIVVALILLLPLFYCCGLPLLTGQVCYDFLSGHVPPLAIDYYLERVFAATIEGDYGWLSTVTSPGVVMDLRQAQPNVSVDYEVLLGDNLAGMYERRIRFDTGATVYVTLHGVWPTCPDFRVTEEEIFENIRLESFRVESGGLYTLGAALLGDWEVSQTESIASSYLEQLGTLTVSGSAYVFHPLAEAGELEVNDELVFLFEQSEGTVLIEYLEGAQAGDALADYAEHDTVAALVFGAGQDASRFLVRVGGPRTVYLHSDQNELSLWSVSRDVGRQGVR